MELGIQTGLKGKEVPYEAQIIRVADEYDAIVSKRQYKSHIGISDTLKILIENSKPSSNSKYGKNNPKIVKALIKVVIDDTEYEITCMISYLDYLKEQIKRLETIDKYHEKMVSSTKQKYIDYYNEGIRILLDKGETIDNYSDILSEYKEALSTRTSMINKLYDELKIIKKLKV